MPKGTDQPVNRECVSILSQCEGASHCILGQRYKCQNRDFPNKNLNFNANLTAVRMALKHSLTHLNYLCSGRWL